MNEALVTKMLAGIDRIEKRQAAYEVVAHRILSCLDMHIEKFDRLIAEVRGENGGNPITASIIEIRDGFNQQVDLLEKIYGDMFVPEDGEDRLAAAEELAAEADMAAAGIPLPVR